MSIALIRIVNCRNCQDSADVPHASCRIDPAVISSSVWATSKWTRQIFWRRRVRMDRLTAEWWQIHTAMDTMAIDERVNVILLVVIDYFYAFLLFELFIFPHWFCHFRCSARASVEASYTIFLRRTSTNFLFIEWGWITLFICRCVLSSWKVMVSDVRASL